MAKHAKWAVPGLVAAAALGLWWMHRRSSTVLEPGDSTMPPRTPRPGEAIPDIRYVAGGDSRLSLPAGREFRVVWTPNPNVIYSAQDTSATEVVRYGDGFVVFRQLIDLPPNGDPSQVFVIATDENDNVLSEHRITIFAPQ